MNASSPSTARELLKLQEVQPGRICLNCPATTLQPGPPADFLQDGQIMCLATLSLSNFLVKQG